MKDKFMVLSQCKQVVDGTAEHVAVEDNKILVGQYSGRGENIPINLLTIASIKKSSASHSAVEWDSPLDYKPTFLVHFPLIVFTLPVPYKQTDSNKIPWWYPPTDEGIAMRDADYDFIISKFGLQCPSLTDAKSEEELLLEIEKDPAFK